MSQNETEATQQCARLAAMQLGTASAISLLLFEMSADRNADNEFKNLFYDKSS